MSDPTRLHPSADAPRSRPRPRPGSRPERRHAIATESSASPDHAELRAREMLEAQIAARGRIAPGCGCQPMASWSFVVWRLMVRPAKNVEDSLASSSLSEPLDAERNGSRTRAPGRPDLDSSTLSPFSLSGVMGLVPPIRLTAPRKAPARCAAAAWARSARRVLRDLEVERGIGGILPRSRAGDQLEGWSVNSRGPAAAERS
jgi:hypothetical protein